jgi:hypothetical protein
VGWHPAPDVDGYDLRAGNTQDIDDLGAVEDGGFARLGDRGCPYMKGAGELRTFNYGVAVC